jgi:hypothetical protein
MAKNELAKAKAAARRKPDKTVEDLEEEGKTETVDNDDDWVDFETQQLLARRKELSVQKFWSDQDLPTLKRLYKEVFPGIDTAEKTQRQRTWQ